LSFHQIFGGATKDEDDEGPPKKKIKIKKEKDGNGDIVDSEGEDTSPPKPNKLAKSSSSYVFADLSRLLPD
jgi:hypothetical protein